MMIPSIDLQEGNAVQLIGGARKEIDAGDPFPIAERFALCGDVAVIDLDAAMGKGSNRDVIERLVDRFPCRVGGGIRDLDTAMSWLDAGASKIILGTAAKPDLLSRLPRERVIAAVDAREGEVLVEGWTSGAGEGIFERVARLRDLVGGFLVTFVEREGRMEGMDMDLVGRVVEAAAPVRVTVAGGVSCAEDVRRIDELGADVQVGMALYSGRMEFADGLVAPMISDREDGLWPTVVADESDRVLGLCWSNLESVRAAVEGRAGIYWSRRRGLWRKGETSGNKQDLLKISLDCDRDALKFVVRQGGSGFCHTGSTSCFGDLGGIGRLEKTVALRRGSSPEGSYTRRLFEEAGLLEAKLAEEARELAEARGTREIVHEAADLLFFTKVAMARGGVSMAQVERELDRRSLKMTRRPGNAKMER